MGEMKNAYKVLDGKPERTRSLGRYTCRREALLKWILRKQDMSVWSGFIWLRI
jgi:hypothetical protein